jgi:hypothetical protein
VAIPETGDPVAVQTEKWTVQLTISYQNTSHTRIFGGATGASDGFDASLDSLAPPPGFTHYSYFYISQFPHLLKTDIKNWSDPHSGEILWTLRIVNAAGKTTSVSWDPSALPPYGHFSLEADISVDMRHLNEVTIAGNREIEIRYIPEFKIPYERGTNPDNCRLFQNYPNPFNSMTTFRYVLASAQYTVMEIFNCQGQKVRSLVDATQAPGTYEVRWDGRMDSGAIVSSGRYMVRMVSGDFKSVRSLVLIK